MNDGFEVREKMGKKTSIRTLSRYDKATGRIGTKPNGRPMITSVSVKREGDDIAPADIDLILNALGVDRPGFWAA